MLFTTGEDPLAGPARPVVLTTAARRRTDLIPSTPSFRHRSPGRAPSLDHLAKGGRRTPLAPLHESPAKKRVSSMSKSMSHLGPQRVRTPIGPATDGTGVPVGQSLDRRSSRSSLALAQQPRMTRSEMLRQKLREANRLMATDGRSTSFSHHHHFDSLGNYSAHLILFFI